MAFFTPGEGATDLAIKHVALREYEEQHGADEVSVLHPPEQVTSMYTSDASAMYSRKPRSGGTGGEHQAPVNMQTGSLAAESSDTFGHMWGSSGVASQAQAAAAPGGPRPVAAVNAFGAPPPMPVMSNAPAMSGEGRRRMFRGDSAEPSSHGAAQPYGSSHSGQEGTGNDYALSMPPSAV